jgi:hypothetical protein
MELVSIDDVAHDILVNATNYLTDIAIFLGLRLIKLMLPVESVADELWSVLWKNRVCYLGAGLFPFLFFLINKFCFFSRYSSNINCTYI